MKSTSVFGLAVEKTCPEVQSPTPGMWYWPGPGTAADRLSRMSIWLSGSAVEKVCPDVESPICCLLVVPMCARDVVVKKDESAQNMKSIEKPQQQKK